VPVADRDYVILYIIVSRRPRMASVPRTCLRPSPSTVFEIDDSSVSINDDPTTRESMKKCTNHVDQTSRPAPQFGFPFFSLRLTMEMNEQNLHTLCTYLRQTLSANATARSEDKLIRFQPSTSLIDRFSGENIEPDRTQ
jgi:hypothetical protein